MAISWAGGTDKIQYQASGWNHTVGTMSFWMKTTQATALAAPLTLWSTTSRPGFGFFLHDTGFTNKLACQGYPSAAGPNVNLHSTTSVTDGAWHHIVFNFNTANGGANSLWVGGSQEATGNSSAAWTIGAGSIPLALGRSADPFWGSYVGQLAELAVWHDAQLASDEIAALAKGVCPLQIKSYAPGASTNLQFYAPLIRDTANVFDSTINITGTTVSDHPRVIGR